VEAILHAVPQQAQQSLQEEAWERSQSADRFDEPAVGVDIAAQD
jgi:hypothetical protein